MIFRSDGALRDGIDSIMLERVQQSDSVPVNSCTIPLKKVFNGYFYPVTPAGLKPRAWILIIESFTTIGAVDAISVDVTICDVESVLGSISRGYEEDAGAAARWDALSTFRVIPTGTKRS